ncbi:MAG: acyl-CoA thioesterase [Desulfuromonas sp.]|nr:MAG: acyl-CoA thioesterase [Desulfuromonas sp.]
MNTITTETELTVRYAETDAQGIVHHANYLVWFEEGRSDFLRQLGLNYTDFEKAGFYIVVAEATSRYKAPCFYEEKLTIETTLSNLRGKMLKFSYRVLDSERNIRAEGETVHVVIGRDRRPVKLPDNFYEALSGND